MTPCVANSMRICSRMLVFASFLDTNFIVVPAKDTGHKYYNQINYKKCKLIIVIFVGPKQICPLRLIII